MSKYYIAYGSNLSIFQMAKRCPTAKVVGTSTLDDWRLLFNGPATIERKKGYKVPILIWEIEPLDEESLDRYEGYPSYYRKETLPIELDGETIDAMVYIMNRTGERRPNNMYYKILEDGYENLGFDERILMKAYNESRERER